MKMKRLLEAVSRSVNNVKFTQQMDSFTASSEIQNVLKSERNDQQNNIDA
jgi:hypothetical protein